MAHLEYVVPRRLSLLVSAHLPRRGAVFEPDLARLDVNSVELRVVRLEGAGPGQLVGIPCFVLPVHTGEVVVEVLGLGGFGEGGRDGRLVDDGASVAAQR